MSRGGGGFPWFFWFLIFGVPGLGFFSASNKDKDTEEVSTESVVGAAIIDSAATQTRQDILQQVRTLADSVSEWATRNLTTPEPVVPNYGPDHVRRGGTADIDTVSHVQTVEEDSSEIDWMDELWGDIDEPKAPEKGTDY